MSQVVQLGKWFYVFINGSMAADAKGNGKRFNSRETATKFLESALAYADKDIIPLSGDSEEFCKEF